MIRTATFFLFLLITITNSTAQTVNITVDASAGRRTISPYIYGKNNNLSDDPSSPTKPAQWKLMRDAGLRFTREFGGNNGSKYNWRLKLSSHPDWYNNVYSHNWDYAAKTFQDSLPDAQGMWGFQLIGKAASTNKSNFDDWSYNGSTYWDGVAQNLAGGGVVNTNGGSKAQKEGDPNLYLVNWTADSTTALLDHWFGTNGLGFNKNKFNYWTMDNEPEIWNGTHDDIMATLPSAEAFMQLYFAVAKKARAKYPDIKLTGPIPATEWQWYNWDNKKVTANGKTYTWMEYFIKRIAEEQKASGIRLLDVIDIHSYPGETKDEDILQLHRIYFDTTYVYPGANGVKTTSPSGWDNNITKEFIFERCNRWLNQYAGPNHHVNFGVSEYGFKNINANVTAVSYASMLGTFAEHNVEYFTPWYWENGMWEVLHLFSRYAQRVSVKSASANEQTVSAYSSINATADSMTIILVNRSVNQAQTVNVKLDNFVVTNGNYSTKQLKQLPANETFESHTKNQLQAGTVNVSNNAFSTSLPALSITAVIIKGKGSSTGFNETEMVRKNLTVYPNPVSAEEHLTVDLNSNYTGTLQIEVFNTLGQIVYSKKYASTSSQLLELPCSSLTQGMYTIQVSGNDQQWFSKFVKQ
ncbi:MAG TPA: glycoside hydrolase family 44 protein [Bacteroidia bacterium]|nr:glycoside hydrolase family 44 protein [Bacteroidia bacterium]